MSLHVDGLKGKGTGGDRDGDDSGDEKGVVSKIE